VSPSKAPAYAEQAVSLTFTPEVSGQLEIPVQDAAPEFANVDGTWIDERRFFQGPRPPAGDWSDRDWIEIPHEHYIPISRSRLLGKLWQFPKAQEAGIHFKHFLELVEAIYHFHYHQTLNELKEDYEYFSPDLGPELRKGIADEELIWREHRFISNFIKTMSRGNFIPFGEKDLAAAKEQKYLFDLSVDVRWDVHDKRMLKDYFDYIDSPEAENTREDMELEQPIREYIGLPKQFDDGLLMFYRGIGRDQAEGTFIMQKIDVLIVKLFALLLWPFRWLMAKIRGKSDVEAISKDSVTSAFDGAMSFLGLSDKKDPQSEAEAEAEQRTVIFDKRWVRRINISNQDIQIKDLFKVSHLQEPALERVLCLFRMMPPQPPKILDRVPAIKKIVEKLMGKKTDEDRDWTIYLKMFKNIPLADSDIVFPEKRVRMRSFDRVMLSITGMLGIFILIRTLMSPTKGAASIALITIVFSYLIKLILGYRRTRANYMARMTQELYHKSLDNDLGVLQYLVDSLEEQEVKEAVLAYYFLWKEGRPMSEKELDGKIEEFIAEHFDGLEVDFEVDDALDKVLDKEGPQPHKHIPIVRLLKGAGPNGEDLYEAKPLEEALEIMDYKWDNFYQYNV
jgi:hypothetical protein